ncbi:MAG: cupin domain-containing protein [Armatimonadota bacterium]
MSEAESQPAAPQPVWVNLLEACRATEHSGPQWAHECEDLDMTLLSWKGGRCIEAHLNTEVDVFVIGVEGTGVVTVNGQSHKIQSGVALLIPKGSERAVESTSERFSYLSVHRRRRGIVLSLNGRPRPG